MLPSLEAQSPLGPGPALSSPLHPTFLLACPLPSLSLGLGPPFLGKLKQPQLVCVSVRRTCLCDS